MIAFGYFLYGLGASNDTVTTDNHSDDMFDDHIYVCCINIKSLNFGKFNCWVLPSLGVRVGFCALLRVR